MYVLFFNVNGSLYVLHDQPTNFSAVGKGHGASVVDDGDVEDSFHGWLIKTREGFPGVCRLHL